MRFQRSFPTAAVAVFLFASSAHAQAQGECKRVEEQTTGYRLFSAFYEEAQRQDYAAVSESFRIPHGTGEALLLALRLEQRVDEDVPNIALSLQHSSPASGWFNLSDRDTFDGIELRLGNEVVAVQSGRIAGWWPHPTNAAQDGLEGTVSLDANTGLTITPANRARLRSALLAGEPVTFILSRKEGTRLTSTVSFRHGRADLAHWLQSRATGCVGLEGIDTMVRRARSSPSR